MWKISWTDRVKNEEVLHRAKEARNILHTVNRRKANYIGHVLRENCLLKHVIEGNRGKVVTGRRGRRGKQLLDDLEEKGGNCKLKEEALERSLWRTGSGRGCGPVVSQPTDWMNDCDMFSAVTYGRCPAPRQISCPVFHSSSVQPRAWAVAVSWPC